MTTTHTYTEVLTYRKLVMPSDMNPANKLFGGRMMFWLDEAAALYASCQLDSHNIVTVKVSEVVFKEPVHCGDFLEFYAHIEDCGRTSLTVGLRVTTKQLSDIEAREVLTCSFKFVKLDDGGKPKPHNLR